MTVNTGSDQEKRLAPDTLYKIMSDAGVRELYFKVLAPNDNSKNQIYLGGDMSIANKIPTGNFVFSESTSRKSRTKARRKIQAPVQFAWIDAAGSASPAPNTKLILYPQYSEVRLSGFLRGTSGGPSDFMAPDRQGRESGRVLFIGVTADGRVIGYLASPDSRLSRHARELRAGSTDGLLIQLPLPAQSEGLSAKYLLLGALAQIHKKGWMLGRRLGSGGESLPCNSGNCGGYTLEAELGVRPNGYSEPDFHGWEIKQYGVTKFGANVSRIITLMTPEPSGGYYVQNSAEAFVRRYGYPDHQGRHDRLNFGGIYRFNHRNQGTGLTLRLEGYQRDSPSVADPGGSIALTDDEGTVAASWSFAKLLDHWKRKHACAVYVQSQSRKNGERFYRYGRYVQLGIGTDFTLLLSAIADGHVYYDPGIKLEEASSTQPRLKRRSQFRISSSFLVSLYNTLERADVTQVHGASRSL